MAAGGKTRLPVYEIRRGLALLPPEKRPRLFLLVAVQVLLGFSDLLAVAMVGVLGTVAVTAIESREVDGLTGRLLDVLGLGGRSTQGQVAALGIAAALLMLSRTAVSIALSRRALHFLAARAADAAAAVVARLLSQPLTFIQLRSSHETQYAITAGVNALTVGILGTLVMILADAAMLLALGVMLLVMSPVVSLLLLSVLVGMTLLLQRYTTQRADALGRESALADTASRRLLTEALSTYRDALIRGSRPRYVQEIRDIRVRAASVAADMTFLPGVSKYVMESTVIVAALVVGAVQFTLSDAETAVGALAVFLAAGTRLAPAMLRIQQGVFTIRSYVGQARPALDLMDALPPGAPLPTEPAPFAVSHEGFHGRIEISNAQFSYAEGSEFSLQDWNLLLPEGALLALVGPSGAGKSTAADLLIGALTPQAGGVTIDGISPQEIVHEWPGAIAYVPQDVWIVDGSIRQNVALGFDVSEVPDTALWRALEAASLADYVRTLPQGLDAVVGEWGTRLSGGQKQRLGIARALVTSPKVLVLDEATSALDAQTEHDVTGAVRALHGKVTTVVIAHRLATVREADVVQYFAEGRVVAEGTFDEVRAQVPDFDAQATLLGL